MRIDKSHNKVNYLINKLIFNNRYNKFTLNILYIFLFIFKLFIKKYLFVIIKLIF